MSRTNRKISYNRRDIMDKFHHNRKRFMAMVWRLAEYRLERKTK